MNYDQAMAAVDAGRAVFSPALCGTVVRLPSDNVRYFVPRITNRRAIGKIGPFLGGLDAVAEVDWELSGVKACAK